MILWIFKTFCSSSIFFKASYCDYTSIISTIKAKSKNPPRTIFFNNLFEHFIPLTRSSNCNVEASIVASSNVICTYLLSGTFSRHEHISGSPGSPWHPIPLVDNWEHSGQCVWGPAIPSQTVYLALLWLHANWVTQELEASMCLTHKDSGFGLVRWNYPIDIWNILFQIEFF